MPKVAIVAALEREVRPLIQRWRAVEKDHGKYRFRFFESDHAVVVCAGIGAEAARRAAEAVIALYAPEVVYSAGFAGALEPELKAGELVLPRWVVNASDGSRVEMHDGAGVLVSFETIASPAQKLSLRESFAAQAVDMEAAAVARAAEARETRFGAVKAISDELGFVLPPMDRFIDSQGRFSEWRFVAHIAVRPWLWRRVLQLARNTRRASRTLCQWLGRLDMSATRNLASVGEGGKGR